MMLQTHHLQSELFVYQKFGKILVLLLSTMDKKWISPYNGGYHKLGYLYPTDNKITGLDIAINKGDSMAPHFHFMGKGASNFRHTAAIANHFCQICQ